MDNREHINFVFPGSEGDGDPGIWTTMIPNVGDIVNLHLVPSEEYGETASPHYELIFRGRVASREWAFYPAPYPGHPDNWGVTCYLESV